VFVDQLEYQAKRQAWEEDYKDSEVYDSTWAELMSAVTNL
jgi:hypothetical protein